MEEGLLQNIRQFSFIVANGTLDSELFPVGGEDYRPSLFEFGSELEQLYVIFLRNLQKGKNFSHARRRAALWLKSYIDQAFVPHPSMEDWELDLEPM